MTKSSGLPNSLYRFEKPGSLEMVRLRDIISQMNITSIKGRQRSTRTMASATLEGSLDEVMARLSDSLEEDYAKNMSEGAHVPWGFDYVITDDATTKGAIDICTRLFNPSDAHMGSAFYGRTVKRIDRDKYLLWIDD